MQKRKQKNTAILLLHCPDQIGLVAKVSDFLLKNNGNVVSLEEHVDTEHQHFYMRVEWTLDEFDIPKEKIGDYFNTLIAKKHEMIWQLHFCACKHRLAIFVSKYSHCFFDILNRWESKEWDVDIAVIVSNHDKFRYVAERHNIAFHHLPINKDNKHEQENKTHHLMQTCDVDLIVLARYMQILTGNFVSKYQDRIINIHHSSLPAFPGANPYKSAYQRGVKIMGATAHYVTDDLDAGPIIYQAVTAISHHDSISELKHKGKDIEKIVLANAVWAHVKHKIISHRNKTIVFT